jgi:hypothetical protein
MAENLRPRLIDPADVGGLPVFNDDILQAQNNNRNTFTEFFELLRSNINNHTGQLSWENSPTTTTTRDMGLIISGCVTDKTGPSPYPVSEGYVYIDGEILKFPGTTVLSGEYIEMKKGTVTNVQRTFKDGSPKDATEEYTLDWQKGTTGPYWSPSYSGVQIVLISPNYTEWQTLIGAQSLLTQADSLGGSPSGVLKNSDNKSLTDAILESYTTGSVKSRKKDLYTGELYISANVETSTFLDGTEEYRIATLPVPISFISEIYETAYLVGSNPANDKQCLIKILTNGEVWIRQPLGESTWPNIGGTSIYYVKVTASVTELVTTPYDGYNTTFMTKL